MISTRTVVRSLVMAIALNLSLHALAVDLPALRAISDEGSSDVKETATVSEQPSAASIAKQLTDVKQRLAQIANLSKAPGQSSQSPDWLKLQQRLLGLHQQMLAQLQTAGEQAEELAADQAELNDQLQRLRSVGLDEPPPYSFLKLDELRDELAAEQSRATAIAAEMHTAERLLEEVDDHRRHNESVRRKAKEAAAKSRGGLETSQLEQALEEARLRSGLTQVTYELRKLQLANLRMKNAASELRATYLTEQVQQVRPQTVFSEADLDTVYKEIDQQQDRLERHLARLQSALDVANESIGELNTPTQQDEAASAAAVPEAGTQRLAAWRTARQVRQARIAMTNQQIGELVGVRYIWDYRHRVFINNGDTAPLRDDFQRVAGLVDRLEESKQMIEFRMEDVRIDLATIEQKLQNAEATAELTRWLEFERDEVKQLLDDYGNSLVHVAKMQRLLGRVAEEARQKLAPTSLATWLENAQAAAASCWNFEVSSIDDHPITVKKLVGTLLLFLVSLLAARLLSRLLGHRVLPRLGANPAIAQALQSVSFYALVAMFSFVTLEFANVPLTVFTYFGGAIAIAVGFGSQNIINNFISGLIILAERPIRHGDLVEVNGLYGTIEHIGARSTRVKTGANLELIIPNSKFLENDVTNWTLSSTKMRTMVSVGVAYGSPTQLVDEILTRVVAAHPDVHPSPPPIVLFKEFGDNALAFEVHFWIDMRTIMQGQRVESAVRHQIDAAMREANITIAFPQRDIHLDTTAPIEINLRRLGRAANDAPLSRAA
ncbi:MAG: mechanosensitive ion channel [Pirellulales bacterium]